MPGPAADGAWWSVSSRPAGRAGGRTSRRGGSEGGILITARQRRSAGQHAKGTRHGRVRVSHARVWPASNEAAGNPGVEVTGRLTRPMPHATLPAAAPPAVLLGGRRPSVGGPAGET